LLFADEPTSRLDPITQQETMQVLVQAVDQNGAALMLVTHDRNLAAAVGTRTLTLGPMPASAPG
jgi:peptide/nickel transport system ATP-binding protein